MGLGVITETLSWLFCTLTVVVFGGYAIYAYKEHVIRNGMDTQDFFLTARDTQPMLRIAWSFLAGYLGVWMITIPAQNAYFTGVVGMIAYSFWCGFPMLMISLVGVKIQERMPNIQGFSDYVLMRFGKAVQTCVVILMLFYMGVALTAEYTSISIIFNTVLGQGSGLIIVIIIGVITMLYTAFGGLLISILTDQYQAIFGSILITIMVIYTCIMFKPNLPPLPEYLYNNTNAYESLLTLPIALISATVFSESPWQRVLASESPRSLVLGTLLAAVGTSVIVFIFGFLGFIASWSNLVKVDNSTSIVFELIKSLGSPDWLIIVFLILAVTMCESTVDTHQNALVSTISSVFLKEKHILWTRLTVVVLNIIPMILSQLNFDIYSIFMIGNKLTTIPAIPLLLGLYTNGYSYITGPAVLFSCLVSSIALSLYGCLTKSLFSLSSVVFAYKDPYNLGSFLVPPCFAIIGLLIWISIVKLLTKFKYPLSKLPGFKIDPQFTSNDPKVLSLTP